MRSNGLWRVQSVGDMRGVPRPPVPQAGEYVTPRQRVQVKVLCEAWDDSLVRSRGWVR